MTRGLTFILSVLLLAACSLPGARYAVGPDLARNAGWSWETLDGGQFYLAAAIAPLTASSKLVIYLEGDGLAYVRPSQPSQNPTPTDPVALRLALAHPAGSGNRAWLGRPCQYVPSPSCESASWTSRRYAPEILDSVNAAIDQLKRRGHAKDVVLIGYSGGGAVAVLLAARRTDVTGVVTVAANLDLQYWIKRDGLSPLKGSLDPADMAHLLGHMPQVHFAGGADKTVGPDVTRSFMNHLPPGTPARIVVRDGYTHSCCWAEDWASVVQGGLTDMP